MPSPLTADVVTASVGLLGYVITVTTREGYGGDIQFAVGVRMDGTVNGMSILDIAETAGLGMRPTANWMSPP